MPMPSYPSRMNFKNAISEGLTRSLHRALFTFFYSGSASDFFIIPIPAGYKIRLHSAWRFIHLGGI